MPKIPFTTKLSLTLDQLNVEPLLKRQIMASMLDASMKSDRQIKADNALDWQALLRSLRVVRSSHTSNKYRWTDNMRPLFEEYETLLNRIRARIEKAQLSGLSVEAYSVRVRTEGKAANGVCDKYWFNWIPDTLKADFVRRLNIQYDAIGRTKGSRLRPFTSPELIRQREEGTKRMRQTIDNIRRACSTMGCENGDRSTSDTPRGALYLAAARMAERDLNRRIKENEQIPVNWLALLTPNMRQRLRDANIDATLVDTSDLHQFYVVHPNADAEAQDAIEGSIDSSEWSRADSTHESAEAEDAAQD